MTQQLFTQFHQCLLSNTRQKITTDETSVTNSVRCSLWKKKKILRVKTVDVSCVNASTNLQNNSSSAVRMPDCQSRGSRLESTYGCLKTFVHPMLLVPFGRDNKSRWSRIPVADTMQCLICPVLYKNTPYYYYYQ